MTLRSIFIVAAFFLSMLANRPWAEARIYESSTVTVSHPWARASAPTARNGAVYLKIEPRPGANDRLVGARSPVAETVEVHETTMRDGIARMRPIPDVEITPGQPMDLAPGGMHLMLVGLKKPLKERDLFPLILTFEKSGEVSVDVVVEAPGAMGPQGMTGTATPEHQHRTEPAHKH